jgi:glycosyltransferase involved in cell wall biosynthesis
VMLVVRAFAKTVAGRLLALAAFPLLLAVALVSRRRGDELIWGPTPIINNKYWSQAMKNVGWKSMTLMHEQYAINQRSDFDRYIEDLAPRALPARLRRVLGPFVAAAYVLRRGCVLHIPFTGGPLSGSALWRREAFLLRLAGVRTIVIPYGADAYLYSRISDATMRHAILNAYPTPGRTETRLRRRIEYWCENADIIIMSWTLDGIPRWDVAVTNMICIDFDAIKVDAIKVSAQRSAYDGRSGPVRVMHAPNHRAGKGTEFINHAVEELQAQGLLIEYVLVERRSNEEVMSLMQEVDILADQVIFPGYGLAAIEGMAHGLPVVCNLDHPSHTALFDRYSFLAECPIVSATPESITNVLHALVTNPGLRQELGRCGRSYVEKYHSYEASQYLFGAIYERLLQNGEVDLATLFHPLFSAFNGRLPTVAHPLREHHLPLE